MEKRDENEKERHGRGKTKKRLSYSNFHSLPFLQGVLNYELERERREGELFLSCRLPLPLSYPSSFPLPPKFFSFFHILFFFSSLFESFSAPCSATPCPPPLSFFFLFYSPSLSLGKGEGRGGKGRGGKRGGRGGVGRRD